MKIKAKVVKNNFGAIAGATVHHVASALTQEAEAIMADSKVNYVPVDTGNLRNSGTVLMPKMTPKVVSVEFGYGGAAAPYAEVVHEYPKAYGQGKNKYLSQPLNKASKDLPKRLYEAVQRAVKAKGTK